LFYAYSELGTFYLKKGILDSAKTYFELSETIEITINVKEFELIKLLNTADYYLADREFDRSHSNAQRAYLLAKKIGNKER